MTPSSYCALRGREDQPCHDDEYALFARMAVRLSV